MTRVLTPPRPNVDLEQAVAPDPEALIKEARRRARRRRAAYAVALVAVAAAIGVFFGFGGGGTKAPRSRGGGERSPRPSRPGLPQAATVEGTLRLSPRDTALFAVRGQSLFAVVVTPGQAKSVRVLRSDVSGHVSSRRVPFDLPAFLQDVSAGPGGIYAGTSVIKRFTSRPDELVRIDPRTLGIRARASFPASVATVVSGGALWATLGDGRVVRLDARTLSIEASQRILPPSLTTSGAATLSKPAFGLGSVWVLAGNALRLELVRLDPRTLEVRSRTRVPSRGRLAQALYHVTADARHVYVVGGAVASVDANGKLGRPVVVPGLANAAVDGPGLVGLTAETPGLVLLNRNGRVLARTTVADAGAVLAVGGSQAWFLGDAGSGNGIVHIRVALR
jgi:hypothetical protein